MVAFVKRFWPPTKSCRLSILWAFALGAVLQIAVPLVLAKLGLILCSVNTVVYALLVFILLRTCVWVRTLFGLDVPTVGVR